jgi:hypothetical protein
MLMMQSERLSREYDLSAEGRHCEYDGYVGVKLIEDGTGRLKVVDVGLKEAPTRGRRD